jgi:hypothetical protein
VATGYDPNDRNHDGRVDNRDLPGRDVHGASTTERVVHATPDPGLTKEVRKDAYERGRADERSRHKRNPLLTFLIALAAIFGLAVIGLYIYNGGSFTETGRDLDQITNRAQQEAAQAGREVADEAGEGLQDVGRRVEQEGESGSARQQPAPAPGPAPERR